MADPLELEWTRLWGLSLLALPVLLLLLARLRTRPPEAATGTLPLWKRIAASTPTAARTNRPRIPPFLWLLALALATGSVALAGPRLTRPAQPRTWTVLLDHGPATALPWLAQDGPAPPGDARPPTRLERALDGALAWLAEGVAPEDRVRWISSGGEELELRGPVAPPRRFLRHPVPPAQPPDWSLHDRPGVLWVTDRLPRLGPSAEGGPEAAGLVTGGGAAVHGAVATRGLELLWWDGTEVTPGIPGEPGARADVRRVWVDGRLPAPIRRIAAVWGSSREGVEVEEGVGSPPVGRALVLERVEPDGERVDPGGTPGPVACSVGRDGWWADAVGMPLASVPLGASVWLRDDAGRPVVTRAPGHLRIALGSMGEPGGDPAAFAVSWGRLLDETLRPAPGVVALAERLSAGDPHTRAPQPPPVPGLGSGQGSARWTAVPLDAWLAAVCLLATLASMATGLLGTR